MFIRRLITTIIASSHLLTCSAGLYYSPHVELSAKKGITGKKDFKRDIGRLGAVIPVLQNKQSVGFLTLIGMGDTKKSIEGNFGLGYRHLLDGKFIVSGYGFYDIRSTKLKNILHQITIGSEFMLENLEFRINGYIPLNEHKLQNYNVHDIKYDGPVNRTLYKKTNNQVVEKGLGGFDIETGGSLPAHNKLSGYVAFYHFAGKGVSSVTGARLRGNYELRSWLSFELESNMDKVRGVTSYLGLNLSWDFGNSVSKKENPLTRLEKKMTKLPVRDIDIVNDIAVTSETMVNKAVVGKAHLCTKGINMNEDKIINRSQEELFVVENIEDLGTNFTEKLLSSPGTANSYVGDNIIIDDQANGTTHLASDETLDIDIASEILKVIQKGVISKTTVDSIDTRTNIAAIVSENDPSKLASIVSSRVIDIREAIKSRIPNEDICKAVVLTNDSTIISSALLAGLDRTEIINAAHSNGSNDMALYNAGVTISEFRALGRSAAHMAAVGASDPQLIAGGYTVSDLKNTLHRTIDQVETLNGIDDTMLYQAHYPVSDFRTVLHRTAIQASAAGATDQELFDGGYSVSDLKNTLHRTIDQVETLNGVNDTMLYQAHYPVSDFRTVLGRSITQAANAGATDQELLDGGFTIGELKTIRTYGKMVTNGIKIKTLINRGIPINDLKRDGVTNTQAFLQGYVRYVNW
jgi:hypothetical protein